MKNLIIVFSTVLILSTLVFSQTKKVVGKKTPTKTEIANKTSPNIQFDSNWQNVPKGFKGNTFSEIYTFIKQNKDKFEKSEFETTEAYKIRINDLSNITISGNLTANGLLAFISNPLTEFVTYNADTQSFYIDLQAKIVAADFDEKEFKQATTLDLKEKFLEKNSYWGFFNSNKILNISDYTATNGFGAKVSVKKYEYEKTFIGAKPPFSLLTWKGKDISAMERNYKLEIKVPLDEAQSAKSNLCLIYVGKLARPFISDIPSGKKPTFDVPKEEVIANKAIILDLQKIWLYNKETGKIYLKL